MTKAKPVIFSTHEVIKLLEYWSKQNRFKEHGNDELDSYTNGVSDGCEYALMLFERCE